jgi:sortase (surface protein transpeptidase)
MIAVLLVSTTAMTALMSFDGRGHTASAAARPLVLRSETVVGAFSGDTLAPAVRLDLPEPSAPSTAAPVVNQSSCRTNLGGEVMTVTIPDISYKCPVYAGGEAMLNSGAATLITDEAIARVLADHPGGSGVLWIAGHRTTHGGAFAAVPTLRDGALITLADGEYTATYRVVGRLRAEISNNRVIDSTGRATGEATLDSIIRADHGGNGASRLLLQTCDGDAHRWMIYADLVTD